jgi:protein TonB
MARLRAWLERHKTYPRPAQRRRMEGTAYLYFVMDRRGRVLAHRLQRSSGHDLLDREVLDLIQRAQPLPGLPASMSQDRLELVVPIQFQLR